MPFRILCLHGMGTQASIFASQTACFRNLLGSSYEFVFANGSHTCDPAPEVADVFPGPYLAWYTSPSTGRVAAAHRHVEELIRANGPFDAVMGFSQGAAVAASILLRHQIARPDSPPPFKAAIFICSPVPFAFNNAHGIDCRTAFGIVPSSSSSSQLPISRPGCPTEVPSHLVTDPKYLNGEVDVDTGLEGTFYQMFHETVDSVRIRVPTLHFWGKRDKWRLHSKDLFGLCDKGKARGLELDAGHEIPAMYAEDITDAVEELLFEVR